MNIGIFCSLVWCLTSFGFVKLQVQYIVIITIQWKIAKVIYSFAYHSCSIGCTWSSLGGLSLHYHVLLTKGIHGRMGMTLVWKWVLGSFWESMLGLLVGSRWVSWIGFQNFWPFLIQGLTIYKAINPIKDPKTSLSWIKISRNDLSRR